MWKYALAGVVALGIGGTTLVYAQQRSDGPRHFEFRGMMNSNDRAAFLDARIAAVRAGLKLTPEQETNWPAVETAVRDLVKIRDDQREARLNARNADQRPDPVERLRGTADSMAALAAGMKRVAEAADPLYKSLDDGQKRRLALLTRAGTMREGLRDRWMDRRDRMMERWHDRRDDRRDDRRGERQERDDGPHRL
jgi:hypothetical protein